MKHSIFILSIFLFLTVSLQSCYTMLNPPKTLPETVSNVISEPVVVSSIGGSGYYGWDPYWEPVLPYTNYYSSYGRSYYSPYNYYDYHHSYYRPIYVVDDDPVPVEGREFSRDEKHSGRRNRTVKPDGNLNASAAGSVSSSPPASSPPTSTPILAPPKPRRLKEVKINNEPAKSSSSSKQKRVRSTKSTSSSKKKDSSSSASSKKTRKRTRK